ncbi:MAG: AraC family transcriptional regulator ligand-binding domain-containing protein [Pseudoruegeria sp.]|jgi:AraC-like DNA-binding protein|tara:strand:- start:1985 stop:2980 length:996 start_codon:yes stop_codon:yes gene_type:complete
MSDLSARVSPIFVEEAFDCARRAGLDGVEIARKCACPPELEEMTLKDYGRFWFALAQEIEDEMLGMATHPMRPGSFALLCHATIGTVTLGQALRRTLWALGVLVGAPNGAVTVRNGQAHIVFTDSRAPLSAFAYRTLLIVLLGPICWLARRRIPLLQVAFRCDAPSGATAYSRLFGTEVQFGAPQTRVVINADYLNLAINRSDAALKRFLNDAPGNLLVAYHGSDDLTGQIRKLLADMSAQDWPDYDELVRRLNMSPSTLRRQLKDQGTCFRDLKAEVRRTRAKHLLSTSNIPVAQVADQLGYTEPSAFFRAFAAWMGTSPAQYRAASSLR